MKTAQEALDYLRDVEKIKNADKFTFDEIEEVHNCLRQNVEVDDTNEALDLAASIAAAQVEGFGTDVDSLLNTILYHSEQKGAKHALGEATEAKWQLAAHFIDSEQYDKFEGMLFEHIQKENFEYHIPYSVLQKANGTEQTPYIIANEVKTLKGMEYLVEHGKIPSDYFTDDSRHSIETASLEQLEFYVKNGANINAVVDTWEYGYEQWEKCSLLDKYLIDDTSKSIEYMQEIIKLGGKRLDGECVHEICHFYRTHGGLPKLEAEKFRLLSQNKMLSYREKHSIAKAIDARTDYLEQKAETLGRKLGNKFGKTADVTTGKITDEHRETAKAQVDIAKSIMKAKRARGENE